MWGALDHPRVGGRRPWVLVVNGGVVVGDGGAVVVVPRRPCVWAFVARKVAVDVARTVYVCATSAVVVAPFVGHHHRRGRCRGRGRGRGRGRCRAFGRCCRCCRRLLYGRRRRRGCCGEH